VVNFVLKRDFQGISLRAQDGISQHGDAGQRLFSATVGTNFADGRGNIALAYEHGEDDRFETSDRSFLRGANRVIFALNPNDTDPAGVNVIPDYLPFKDLRYSASTRGGGIDVNFDGFPDYIALPGGGVAPYVTGTFIPGGYEQGGSATSVADYTNDLLPKTRRNVFNLIGHFDVSPALSFFVEGKYARTKSFSLAQPTFDYYLYVPYDNAYMPAGLAGLAPYGDVLINRDNFDLGQRGEDILRQTYRGVFGARGDIGSHANYEVSYVYGRTDVANKYIANQITDRFYAALDAVIDPATGQPTCRINLDPTAIPYQPYAYIRGQYGPDSTSPYYEPVTFKPGECVPLNLFGEGSPSQAAIDWITADTVDRSRITQSVASGSVSGDLGALFTFPGGGALGYALGAEYRKETSNFVPDPLAAEGVTFTNKLSHDHGEYSVKEAFGEVRLPIFQKLPFAYNLELGGAIRFSDYSSIGSTKAWKLDASYAPVSDITFTGTYSTAVRAPNIGELYSGQSQTYEFFNDPCNYTNIASGTSYRAANCAALLTSLGVANPATYIDTRTTNIPGVQGGNPNLAPETAKTWTAGVILKPRFLPGFTGRLDWYNIKLKNAINTVSANQLAQLCVDQPSLNNQFCDAITRQNGTAGPNSAGNIIGFVLEPQNVAQFATSGLDVNLNYRLHTATMGTFTWNVIGNYLQKLQFIGTPGADITNSRNEAYAPKYTVNSDLTWNLGRFTLNYHLLWFDKTLRFSNLETSTNPDITLPQYIWVKAHWQHDIYASVDVAKKFTLFGGVNNLFNQQPAIGTSRYPVDSVGRFFYAGAKVRFNKIM
jgi:outer membrane receptor protein involved in Fe transport